MTKDIEGVKAWGMEIDGELAYWAESEKDFVKNHISGNNEKPVKVRIIREVDFQNLLRMKSNARRTDTSQKRCKTGTEG